jgi:hypothetical protein
MVPEDVRGEAERAAAAQFADESGPDEGAAWEEVGSGRYMPRRIKGSYRGRALG